MRTLASLIAIFCVSLVLSGCGGDSGSGCGHLSGSGSTTNSSCGTGTGGTGGTGGTTTPTANTLTVSSTAASIPADGSGTATITVLAKDANNNAVAGVPVTLAASSGTLSSASGATTAANGTVTATLSATGATSGTAITVTASAGSVTSQTTVNVVATQQTITLTTSSSQMQSNNSAPVTIQAIVRGANNQLISGVPVTFSADSGAIGATQTTGSSVPAGTTDVNGVAQATLSTPADPSNRTITVTAALANGTTLSTIKVSVVGTVVSVSGPVSLILGSTGTFNVSVVDSAGNGIGNQKVTLTSALSNALSATSVTTDNTGHATVVLTASNSGTDKITGAALGGSGSASVAISSQTFSITAPAPNALVMLNTPTPVTVLWKNNGQPVANGAVKLTTTRGTFAGGTGTINVTTDATGTATASLSSSTGGPAEIEADGTGVSAVVDISFIATTPARITLQASPSTIATGAQSTITAIVWDAQNNLVQGQNVSFQLTDHTGGTLSPGNATSDLSGRAQVVYKSTSTPSGANGVVITATVGSLTASTPITVGGQSVSLTLAESAVLSENEPDDTLFSLPYTVTALDSSGRGVSNATISLTVHSYPFALVPAAQLNISGTGSTSYTYAAYAKGSWVNTGCTDGNKWCRQIAATCYNEDVDGSAILQSSAEDVNGNHQLDPSDVATVQFTGQNLVTDSSGHATFNLVYPEQDAGWVQVYITATTTVSGTESTTSTAIFLPQADKYIGPTTTLHPSPIDSPFGVAPACTNPR
jgi:hypothetical protein